jgi:hypothetical protein
MFRAAPRIVQRTAAIVNRGMHTARTPRTASKMLGATLAGAAAVFTVANCSWYNPVSWFASSVDWNAVRQDVEAAMVGFRPLSRNLECFGSEPLRIY